MIGPGSRSEARTGRGHAARLRALLPDGVLTALWLFAALAFVSPVWIETDAYRYAAAPFLIFGLAHYLRRPYRLMPKPRPPLGPLGWLCIGWAAYVGLRYGFVMLSGDESGGGSAEGLYLFPLVFSTLGWALYLLRDRLRRLPALFLGVSLVVLAASIDFADVFAGLRTPFLYQNNTIHASVAAGLIAVAALSCIHHALNGHAGSRAMRALMVAVAGVVIALCLVGIFGAKSKGVWFALAIVVPVQVAWIVWRLPRKVAVTVGVGLGLAAVLALGLAAGGLMAEAGPHLAGIAHFAGRADTLGVGAALNEAIRDESLPFSLRERLALWGNGFAVWATAPWFGSGIAWEAKWNTSPFGTMHYNLIHNGYLEIAIRYGVVGLGLFALIYAWFGMLVLRAKRAGLIRGAEAQLFVCAVLFLALTLLTNSNNRLAIGEMTILGSAAFGFCCWFALSEAKRRR